MISVPPLPERLQRLCTSEYPRFSAPEMRRRRSLIEQLLNQAGCDHLLYCGANRFGGAVQWLSQWPVTAEAVAVFTPGERDALFVQYVNHAELAGIIANEADVSWGGPSSIESGIEILKKRRAKPNRVAFIGPLSIRQHARLASEFGMPHDLNSAYAGLRTVKSDEELDWFRIGGYFSDLGMAALRNSIRPGVSEVELGARIEQAYTPLGGGHVIHFVGTTPMDAPSVPVPKQFPSRRQLAVGDAISAEISAAFWEHSGQVLRSFTLGKPPSALYQDLHDAADATFDAICSLLRPGVLPSEVVEASGVIEKAGFTIIDDLVHGFGGGYLPPILGCKSRPAGPVPTEPFKAGQMIVVQPNVVTRDGKAGVQMGELLVVTKDGIERMQRLPRGFDVIPV